MIKGELPIDQQCNFVWPEEKLAGEILTRIAVQ